LQAQDASDFSDNTATVAIQLKHHPLASIHYNTATALQNQQAWNAHGESKAGRMVTLLTLMWGIKSLQMIFLEEKEV